MRWAQPGRLVGQRRRKFFPAGPVPVDFGFGNYQGFVPGRDPAYGL